jgi:hypothetical protein
MYDNLNTLTEIQRDSMIKCVTKRWNYSLKCKSYRRVTFNLNIL